MSQGSGGGMDHVIATESAITAVDGQRGELRYRGYEISEVARHLTFEAVAALLWNGDLPSDEELSSIRRQLRSLRIERSGLLSRVGELGVSGHPLDVLRYVVSWDALSNPDVQDNSQAANRRKALEFTAWFPLVVAAYHRLKQGMPAIPADPDMDTAGNFLFVLHGRAPSDLESRTLDTSLILHADHELNASTFAARVTIATQSNLHSAVASALGTLAGPRHGGASERVIAMLEDIGDPARAEGYVQACLARHERSMGFGHRVYRTADPRSIHLRAMAERLLADRPESVWLEILERLASIMQRERGLYPNVDLYAAVVNRSLGVRPEFYTSIFAMSRIAGWTAHAMEGLDGRMIRPAARYVGPPPRALPVAGVTGASL